MSRKRMVAPSILRNPVLREHDSYLRLWLGIILDAADGWGCLRWNPEELGVSYLWCIYRQKAEKLGREGCERFVADGMVRTYEGPDGRQYAWLPRWVHYQTLKYPGRPDLPEPPFWATEEPALHESFRNACGNIAPENGEPSAMPARPRRKRAAGFAPSRARASCADVDVDVDSSIDVEEEDDVDVDSEKAHSRVSRTANESSSSKMKDETDETAGTAPDTDATTTMTSTRRPDTTRVRTGIAVMLTVSGLRVCPGDAGYEAQVKQFTRQLRKYDPEEANRRARAATNGFDPSAHEKPAAVLWNRFREADLTVPDVDEPTDEEVEEFMRQETREMLRRRIGPDEEREKQVNRARAIAASLADKLRMPEVGADAAAEMRGSTSAKPDKPPPELTKEEEAELRRMEAEALADREKRMGKSKAKGKKKPKTKPPPADDGRVDPSFLSAGT